MDQQRRVQHDRMRGHIAIMYIAVIVVVSVMMVAATPLAEFVERNPTIVMLALGFLLIIGMTLIADGTGNHIPKGYIYAAMGFEALVEGLNMLARKKKTSSTWRRRGLDVRLRTSRGQNCSKTGHPPAGTFRSCGSRVHRIAFDADEPGRARAIGLSRASPRIWGRI